MTTKSGRSAWRLTFSSLVLLFIASLIAYSVDVLTEHALQQLDGRMYQLLVASGPRKPTPRFTAVITLDPPRQQTMLNVCRQRGLLGELIRATAELGPAVIVVDKYFGQECHSEEIETRALRRAVHDVSRSVPIVVGRIIDDPLALQLRLSPSLDLDAGDRIAEGIVNTDEDIRRLPLGWLVGPTTEPTPTLSIAAALAYDPLLLDKVPALRNLIKRGEHPYIAFLDPHDVEKITYSGRDILCSSTIGNQMKAPLECGERASSSVERLAYLRNRIVVIGEKSPHLDVHPSVVGSVSGFTLQANYIEAVLDGRYLRAGHRGWNYAAGLLLYFILHWIIVAHRIALRETSGWRVPGLLLRALGLVLAILVGGFGTLYLIVMHLGWFVDPVRVGFVVIVFKLTELLLAKTGLAEPNAVRKHYRRLRHRKATV